MKKLIFVVTFWLAARPAHSQNPRSWLAATLGAADTVWLIGHSDLRKLQDTDFLLRDGRLNSAILRQQKMLDVFLRDSLIMILTAVIEFDRVEETLCFDPQQAIVWSKSGKLSYIDCCFHCLRFIASSDLTLLQGGNFDYRKWAMLQAFFERQGMGKSNREGYGEKQ